jgi:hypothetical protein
LLHLFSGKAPDKLLIGYLIDVRNADPAGAVPPAVITKLVEGRSPLVHVFAFNELYRRRERPPLSAMCRQMRQAGVAEDQPEPVVRRLAFEARYGNLDEARRLALLMYDLQTRKNRGANPFTAHRALLALADREKDIAAEMWRLAANCLKITTVDSSAESEDLTP